MVSLKDVAMACGVSVATVSKALNGHSDVGAATTKRIREKAREMGYSPNTAARALKTHKTYNIGVLFADGAQSGLTHDYFSSVLEGVRVASERHGYDITFINNKPSDHFSYYDRCMSRGVDGVIAACVNFESPYIKELLAGVIPVITIDHVFNQCSAVVSDNVTGMRELTEYIVANGHRRIAFIHGEPSSVTQDRVTSFYRTLYEHDIKVPDEYVLEGRYRDTAMASECTKQLMNLRLRPTCIIYPDDFSCIGGINAITKMGLSIPDDVSIAGYDGQNISEVLRPALTTVRQDTRRIGGFAAERLIQQIEHPKTTLVEHALIEGHLVNGASVRKLV